MTVIAAFPVFGVPALVGDMLVTAPATKDAQSFLRTAPSAAARMPEQIGARVAGTRKKVHLIGSNLAVAWSGSEFAASRVMRRLYETFSSSPATERALADELGKIDNYQDDRFAVHLIGWVIDSVPLCFRWNSMWHSQIFRADSHFEGSGEDVFRGVLSEQPSGPAFGPGVASSKEAAVLFLLAKLSKLIDKEIWTGETLRNCFGYCYEIAIFDGSAFQYVDQISYLTWQIRRDSEAGGYHYRFGPTLIKYRSVGEYSIVQVSRQEGERPGHTDVNTVTSVHNTMPGLDPASLGRQSIEASYYCNFLRYTATHGQIITGPFVTHASDQNLMGHKKMSDGKDFMWLNMAAINDSLDIFPASFSNDHTSPNKNT
jgi:hypothetical protein